MFQIYVLFKFITIRDFAKIKQYKLSNSTQFFSRKKFSKVFCMCKDLLNNYDVRNKKRWRSLDGEMVVVSFGHCIVYLQVFTPSNCNANNNYRKSKNFIMQLDFLDKHSVLPTNVCFSYFVKLLVII